jgi:hypothetical protein
MSSMDIAMLIATLPWLAPTCFAWFARRRDDWFSVLAPFVFLAAMFIVVIELPVFGLAPLGYGLLFCAAAWLIIVVHRGSWGLRLMAAVLFIALWPAFIYLGWLLLTPWNTYGYR